jgi:hypothetical protein
LPYVTRPKHPRGRLVGAVAATVIALLGVPAAAQAACPTAATVKPFTAFGDNANYSLLSNGAFEYGTGGWTLSDASVAADNESFKVRASTDSKSLAIGANGVAVSPAFCVSTDHPSFRFFAKRTGGNWGVLTVSLRWSTDGGATNQTVVGTVTSGTSWSPTQSFNLSQILGIWNANQVGTAQIVFDPENAGGSWAIDDVYIDPYTRG